MKKSRQIFAGVMIAGVLATGIGALAGCGDENGEPLANASSVYGFAGATAGAILSDDGIGGAMLEAADMISAQTLPGSIQTQLETTIKQTLDKYMNIFDNVVGGKNVVDVKHEALTEGEYAHKLTVSAGDNTSVIYFNETLKSNPTQDVGNINKEVETKIEGELYFNESATPIAISGGKVIDPEDNEVEIILEVKIDETHKITFSQEIEEENGKIEEDYTFEVVLGAYSQEFSIDLERNKNGNIELEYEYEVGQDDVFSFTVLKTSTGMYIETEDFAGYEVKFRVELKEGTGANEGQTRYVYTIEKIGNLQLGNGIEVHGAWRD